jgi:two-component system LytT family sensor kinase
MATLPLDPPHVEAFEPSPDLAELRDQRIRAVVWLTLIFWVSNYVLLTLATALAGNEHLKGIVLVRFGEVLLGIGVSFLFHLMLRSPRLSTTRQRLIALAIVTPVAAEIFAWAIFFIEAAVDPTLNLSGFTWAGAVRTIAFWTWYFLAWAGMYLAVSYGFDLREEQQRTAETRERAHVAQLRALHSQINPHFLFNSLNSVSALMLEGSVDLADEMVGKLARFLRLGLAADPTDKIALSSEIELQRTYLEIEQLRYQDLVVTFSVPEELDPVLVPALILQPIVENAVKYGVAGAPPPASIEIKAWSAHDRLVLEVIDSGKGQGPTSSGGGIGLANVNQRLGLIYGNSAAALSTNRLADGSFHVRIEFPLELP